MAQISPSSDLQKDGDELDAHDFSNMLLEACKSGDAAEAQRLLHVGARIDVKDKEGKNSLGLAAANGNTALLSLLLSSGAGIDASDAQGNTAFLIATAAGRLETVKYLVDHGANINAVNKRRESSLLMAALRGHTELAVWLAEQGVDITVADLAERRVMTHYGLYATLDDKMTWDQSKLVADAWHRGQHGSQVRRRQLQNCRNWLIVSFLKVFPCFK
jgi:ankyrin repeat protein